MFCSSAFANYGNILLEAPKWGYASRPDDFGSLDPISNVIDHSGWVQIETKSKKVVYLTTDTTSVPSYGIPGFSPKLKFISSNPEKMSDLKRSLNEGASFIVEKCITPEKNQYESSHGSRDSLKFAAYFSREDQNVSDDNFKYDYVCLSEYDFSVLPANKLNPHDYIDVSQPIQGLMPNDWLWNKK